LANLNKSKTNRIIKNSDIINSLYVVIFLIYEG